MVVILKQSNLITTIVIMIDHHYKSHTPVSWLLKDAQTLYQHYLRLHNKQV